MTNQEVAAIFYQLAWRTSLKGEPVFKTAAYRKVARAIAQEPRPLAELRAQGQLRQIPGVGDKIEAKIGEILDTGRLGALERLRAETSIPKDRPPRVAVVGSLNMDLVVWAPRRPQPGESLPGTRFAMFLGGKGFNQAVAAARLGATVAMIGRVGTDPFGDSLLAALKREGIAAHHVARDAGAATGVALPLVEPDGTNSIVVVLGANLALSPQDIDQALETIATVDALLLQLEVPQATVLHAARIAHAAGVLVILNPAPAQTLLPELVALSDWLVPNEVEAAMLTGEEGDPALAGRHLLAQGARGVVITLGHEGALVMTPQGEQRFPAFPVTPVDTTAAGDAFCGALAVALAEGQPIAAAVRFANAAGALATTVAGAEPSLPKREAVQEFLARSTN